MPKTYHYPGTRPGKKRETASARFASLAVIFPILPCFLPFFPQYGTWSQAQTITLSASELLDAIKLMMLNLLSVATKVY